ncbi:Xaa-Pro aminopeptidase [Natronoarchaeum philippinense]|uniref:Xaa-Pro aminopeptidase n=1 Tax=Natronoarchaeum philippinense TaxID=558529 RepID=A0A285NAZ6_NATPI|nr:M24 family metallopeptidase [Natronoarchaeum philippinense]SNZ06610.1 Xaa-Pro aminopeptidase [Natronoarchaeum philippinense]
MAADTTPSPDYERLAAELAERDAAALVVVGDRHDADLAYCAGGAQPARQSAVVLTPAETLLYVPDPVAGRASETFPGDAVRTFDAERRHPAQVAADALDDAAEGEVLTPATIGHDAALYLERAGYDVASTDAVAQARERKSDAELARIELAQQIAAAGIDRARTVLAEATVDGEQLLWDDEVLTTERLRREVDAAMAGAGGDPARNTRVGVDGPPVDPALDGAGATPLRPAATITVSVAPREPAGYHGRLSRTLVVDGEGGWERRANVATENARAAALAELSDGAGAAPASVRGEIVAELGAYGFDATPESGVVVAELGGGVGLERREAPRLTDGGEISAGTALAIRPGLSAPEQGHVELTDIAVVHEDGVELLGDYSTSMAVQQ